jgi:hypothetical protein
MYHQFHRSLSCNDATASAEEMATTGAVCCCIPQNPFWLHYDQLLLLSSSAEIAAVAAALLCFHRSSPACPSPCRVCLTLLLLWPAPKASCRAAAAPVSPHHQHAPAGYIVTHEMEKAQQTLHLRMTLAHRQTQQHTPTQAGLRRVLLSYSRVQTLVGPAEVSSCKDSIPSASSSEANVHNWGSATHNSNMLHAPVSC